MKRIIFPLVALLISYFSFAQVCSKSQLPANLQNGLVAFYPFCGNANDESGNGNNGTVNGATLTTDRFGNLNSAYSFSGNTISVPYKSYLSFSDNKKFSVSIWIYTSVNNITTHYIGMRQPGSQTQFWQLYTPVTSAVKGIAFQSFTNGNILGASSQNQQIPLNVWSNLVGTYDNGVWKLYLNGILIQSSTSTLAFNNDINAPLTIGNSGNFEPFNGRLDDVRIYNRALTECEVQQLYNETSGSTSTPNGFNYNFLPMQKSVCGTSTPIDAGSGFVSYLWSTGATSQTITATSSGEYRVTVTNNLGCVASDTINVSLVKADILQSDQTVCVNTPLTLSVNSYASQSAKTIDFDNVGLAALDVTGGTAGSVSGVSGNGLSISRPTEVKTKDQTYGYGDYEVDAKTGTNTSNQYLSVLLPLNSWTNEAISIDSRPAGTDDVGWGVYVNAVRVAFANGTHPAGASTWYKMKIRVTPDSVKCWINSTLLYQGLNTTVPRNIGAVKLSSFSTSHFDNLKYIPYQTFSSVLWSTSATTSTISVTPTATTTYYATISDGISSCRDSVTLTVANIVGFAPLQDTVKVCGDSLELDAGAGFASYNWSSGATTRIVTAKTSGRYIATVFNASGCSASDTSVVSIVKAKILQRDTTICKVSSITLAVDSSSLNKSSACLKSSLPAQLQNGLIAYYPFCGNANDGSGNGINGILFGAPTLVADRFGNSNAAYNFNGTNQYIQTASISEPVTTKTISAWVKLSNISQMGGGLAAVQSANGSVFDAIVYNETNNGWGFGSDNLTRTRWSGVKETSSNWVMLTATYENNSYNLYRNGVLISSTTQFPITSFGTSSKFNIGLRHDNGGTPYLNGAIDDVFFYNRVLTSSEIMSLYNSSSSVNWSNGATSNTITVSPTATTKYFVTVTDGITTCRDSITVTVSDIGSFNPLQDTVKVCGDSAVLDASIITIAIYPPVAVNATYRWSNGATTGTISAKASGKYYVTVTNESGCSASDTSFVSIVKASIIQSDTTVCKGATIRLSADTLVRGLLAYYPLDNNAQDLSGNNMNGVVTGATPTTDRFGQANKAYFFNGTSDFIKVNHDTRLNRLPLTVSCWFNANQQISPAGALVGKYYAASWTGWQLTLNEYGPSSQRLDPWYIRTPNNYIKNSSTTPNFHTTSIIDSSWHHIAFVIDSTSGKIYLDGNLQATANWVGPAGIPSNTWPMYFGYYPSGNAPPNIYYYRGKIDDIRLYDKALNNSEVQSAMSSNVTQYQYLWSNGATTPTIEVRPNTTTKYFVTVTDGITTCRDSVTITVDDLSNFNPLQDTVKICGDSTMLDAGAGYATYNWSNGATTRTITAKASGKYFVNVANASGCSASDTSVVSIVKAKIIQRDTTICKGSDLKFSIDSSFSSRTFCVKNDLPFNLQSGLVAYYPFCGNANDASGNGNHGVVNGAILTTDRFGNQSSAYQFNGQNSLIRVAHSNNLNLNSDFTISCWFMSDVAPNYRTLHTLLAKRDDNRACCSPNVPWHLSINFQPNILTDYKKPVMAFSKNGSYSYVQSSTEIKINSWQNIIATYSQDTIKMYLDGKIIHKEYFANSNRMSNTSDMLLGAINRELGAEYLQGKLDDVFIYNRCVTQGEIYQLSNSSTNSVLWSNGSNSNSINISPSVTTKYFVTVTDGITACRDSILVTVSDIGTFNPLQDTVKVCGDSTVLDAGAGYATYNWSNGATTRTITAKASGKYFVNVANVSGCSASDTSVVSIVKAKIIQRDTVICKGSTIKISTDSLSVNSACDKASLPLNLQNGLVAFYPFCGNANDISGNGNDGTVFNAQLASDRFGNINSAYQFDGTTSYIDISKQFFNNGSNQYSISLWFNSISNMPTDGVGQTLLNTNPHRGLGLSYSYRGDKKLSFWNQVDPSSIGNWDITQNPFNYTVNLNQWINVVIVKDGLVFKLYVNGAFDKEVSISTNPFLKMVGMQIGSISCCTKEFFKGKIDDVGFWNRALRAEEILQLYGSTSGQTVLWSTGATTPSITVNPTVKTTYTVTVTDGINTCTDSVVVDVSSSELKVTDPSAVCSPGVVNLTAAAITSGSATGLTYTYWKDANATQALANPDKVSVSGTYYIVGKSSTGCTSAPTAVKVTVNPLPVATIIAPTQTAICDKSSITLTARGGTSYQWLLNGSAIAGAIDSTYAASQAGSYEVNVIALGCTSKVAAPVNLTLIKAAIPKFSNSSTCIDVPVSFFNETDTTLSGSVIWLWDFGDGQTSTLLNPIYTYKKSGGFIVKLTVTPKLCSSLPVSFTKNITVDIPPVGIKYPNVLAVKNKATPLSARFIANGYTYLWMPSTGLNNGALQKPIFNASNEQLYRIRLTSASGCITMDTVKVSVYDSSDIFVPKAFSPNKDGKNDLLQPFLVNITTLKFFRVYNRWGQLMFQSSDSKQGWDGMYNYKPQPLETYTWIAEGIDGNGTTIFRKGQTVLIR